MAWASPHTRGWTRGPDGRRPDVRGFPAHAGMDLARITVMTLSPGLPPHTRGWTPESSAGLSADPGFPRTRGDRAGRAAAAAATGARRRSLATT